MNEQDKEIIGGLQKFIHDVKDGVPLKTMLVGKVLLAILLKELGLTVSVSNNRRLVSMGAVKINGVLHDNPMTEVVVRDGDVLEVGRNKYVLQLQRDSIPRPDDGA